MKHIPGIKDEAFIRGKIPMTKQEVRMLTLLKARIKPGDVVLDVGAGTGSLSVEAALLSETGVVYAIERKGEGAELIRRNAEKFGAGNIEIIEGEAPSAMEGLPACDAILIGGSGKYLPAILDRSMELLKPEGHIVLNCVTLQTAYEAVEYMRRCPEYSYEAIQVQINRLNAVGSYDMAQALNPIHIISCEKR